MTNLPIIAWALDFALLILKEDAKGTPESSILAFCKERLADFKCPKKIYIVDAIPRTSAGKFLKTALRATFGDRLTRAGATSQDR